MSSPLGHPFALTMILTRSSGKIWERRPMIGDDHMAPLVQVLLWIFLAFSILSVSVHFVTKRLLAVRFGPADLILSFALVSEMSDILGSDGLIMDCDCRFSESPKYQVYWVPQVKMLEILHWDSQRKELAWLWRWISSARYIHTQVNTERCCLQTLYSVEMLNIIALVTTKAALLTAIHAITPVSAHRRLIYATSILTVSWGISGVFTIAFQCPGPERWNVVGKECINIVSLKIRATETGRRLTQGTACCPDLYSYGQHLDRHWPSDHPVTDRPETQAALGETSRRHGGLLFSYTVCFAKLRSFYILYWSMKLTI